MPAPNQVPTSHGHFQRGEAAAGALMAMTGDVISPMGQAHIALGAISKAAEWLRAASGAHEAARLLYGLADRYGAEGAASSDLINKTKRLDQRRKPHE